MYISPLPNRQLKTKKQLKLFQPYPLKPKPHLYHYYLPLLYHLPHQNFPLYFTASIKKPEMASSTPKTNKMKFKSPPTFEGKQKDLNNFLAKCNLYFNYQGEVSPKEKILFTYSMDESLIGEIQKLPNITKLQLNGIIMTHLSNNLKTHGEKWTNLEWHYTGYSISRNLQKHR